MNDKHLGEGFSYQLEWPAKLWLRTMRTMPRSGAQGTVNLTLPSWFVVLFLVVILTPTVFLGSGLIGLQASFGYIFGLVGGGILVGAFFWIVQWKLMDKMNMNEPVPMRVSISPAGVSLDAAHFQNTYDWRAVDQVSEIEDGLLIWMRNLLIALVPDNELPGGVDRAALKQQIDAWRGETAPENRAS